MKVVEGVGRDDDGDAPRVSSKDGKVVKGVWKDDDGAGDAPRVNSKEGKEKMRKQDK